MKLFSIARFDNNETWTILERFATYEEADDAYDEYADKFPFSMIDILYP